MTNEKQFGLILYTDGGARPQNGRAGWGLHGYLYHTEVPKKGSGNPTHVPTADGYIPKTMPESQIVPVTPLFYIDGMGSFHEDTSNNVAELRAAVEAFRLAVRFSNSVLRRQRDGRSIEPGQTHYYCTHDTTRKWDVDDPKTATFDDYTVVDLTYLKLYADSRYVVDNYERLSGWVKNGWRTADGSPVANQELWKQLREYDTMLQSRSGPTVQVTIDWVKSHTDDKKTKDVILGNVIADRLATVGVYHARHRETVTDIDFTRAEGYWKNEVDRHVFLNLPLLHFSDAYDHNGSNVFFMTTPVTSTKKDKTKSDTTRIALDPDASYALVMIDDVDPTIRLVADYHRSQLNSTNAISVMYLDDVFSVAQNRLIEKYGKFTLRNVGREKTEIGSSMDRLLTSESYPPGNAYKTIEMSNILAKFLGELDPDIYVENDLTDLFYDRETKKDVERFSLKPEYKVGMSAFKVVARFHVLGGSDQETELILRFGVDCPTRNHFKRMETLNPRVTLVTYIEGSRQLRYVIRISTRSAKGVWAAWYSNFKLIPSGS